MPNWHAHAAILALPARCAAGMCILLVGCCLCQVYCQSAHAASKAVIACSAEIWTARDFWRLLILRQFLRACCGQQAPCCCMLVATLQSTSFMAGAGFR